MARSINSNLAHLNRQQLENYLKGQKVYIPNLHALNHNWPDWHHTLISDPIRLAMFIKADLGLFAATWWPHADFEELRIVAYLEIWLFLWDDEIDESPGSLNKDFEAAQVYRRNTVKFVEYCLGFGHYEDEFQSFHPLISTFAEIGKTISAKYTLEQRQNFLTEILFYIKMTEQEQQVRMSGDIPSASDYLDIRLGACGVGVCLSAIEYANQMQLPGGLKQDPDMKVLWKEEIMIIAISNDILSLKKELSLGAVDSLIPISYNSGMTVQEAIDNAIIAIEASIAEFDAAAARLLLKWCSTGPLGDDNRDHVKQISSLSEEDVHSLPKTEVETSDTVGNIKRFIDNCRDILTGNITWSLTTDRYAISKQPRDAYGGIEITL